MPSKRRGTKRMIWRGKDKKLKLHENAKMTRRLDPSSDEEIANNIQQTRRRQSPQPPKTHQLSSNKSSLPRNTRDPPVNEPAVEYLCDSIDAHCSYRANLPETMQIYCDNLPTTSQPRQNGLFFCAST